MGACRHRIAVSESLRDAKGAAVRQGFAPAEIDWLAKRFESQGSPYSLRLGDLLPEPAEARGALGVFPACTALVHDPDELRHGLLLLRRAGKSPAIALSQPPCCGYPLDTAGLQDAFREHAQKVAASLEGFEQVVATGPACAFTLLRRYPQVGAPLRGRVTPIIDLLAQREPLWRSLAQPHPQQRYAYHDPCFLGRRLGRYEEPRRVLRAVLGDALQELPLQRESSRCAGGGGVYPLTHPQAAKTCAEKLWDLAELSEADVLVTACASVQRRLSEGRPESRAVNLVSLLARRVGLTT